jgi:hypothetical protein
MLLVIVAIVGIWWALLVPPWQAPDSPDHFAYTQSIAENFRLPGAPGRATYSTDQLGGATAVGSYQTSLYPWAAPPNWSAADWHLFRRETGVTLLPRGNGGGRDTAEANPPLYYLYAAVGYLIDRGGTALGRLYSIQLWGVLLLLATTVGGWLLAGETFGRQRTAQLACASVVGLLPMMAFLSTSVNADSMLITVWTFALWLGARVINRRAGAIDSAALCAATSAAILIKATGYALVLPSALALAMGWLQRPRPERRRHLITIALASLALLLPVLGWITFTRATGRLAVNPVPPPAPASVRLSGTNSRHVAALPRLYNLGDFLTYLWEFYLPRLPFMSIFRETPSLPGSGLPVYLVWLQQAPAGIFGWLTVYMPGWVYTVVSGLVGAIALGALALLTRIRGSQRLRLLGFYAAMLVALLGFLHINDYRVIAAGQGMLLQGRYLLPVFGLLGLCVGLIVTRVPVQFRAAVCGLTLTGVLGLEAIALVTVLQAYYV